MESKKESYNKTMFRWWLTVLYVTVSVLCSILLIMFWQSPNWCILACTSAAIRSQWCKIMFLTSGEYSHTSPSGRYLNWTRGQRSNNYSVMYVIVMHIYLVLSPKLKLLRNEAWSRPLWSMEGNTFGVAFGFILTLFGLLSSICRYTCVTMTTN